MYLFITTPKSHCIIYFRLEGDQGKVWLEEKKAKSCNNSGTEISLRTLRNKNLTIN